MKRDIISPSVLWAISLVGGLVIASCSPAVAPPPTRQATGIPTKEASTAATPKPTAAAAAAAQPAVTPKPSPGSAKRGGTLRVLVNADPRTYDMHTELSYSVLAPVGPAYDGLLEYDDEDTGKIVPALAERWEASNDQKVFTFYLRKDVKWHDGKPFTAEDAEFSLKRLVANSPNLKEPLAFVDKVEALDDSSIKVTLKQPAPIFMPILADGWAAIMPKHVIEARGNMQRVIVGTGPFKFRSHDVGASMQHVRNPDYFVKEKPYVDNLILYPIRDVSTAQAAFRAKKVDITGIMTMTTAGFRMLEAQEPKANIARYPSLGWWNFVMPINMVPWNDIKVRRAVYLGLDRDAFVTIIEQGYGSIGSIVPPIMGGPKPEELRGKPGFRQPKDADLAEAKKLLQEAGYGAGFSTKMFYRVGEPFQTAAVLMKSQLANLGITVELDPRTEAEFYEYAYRGGYHSFHVRTAWKLPDPDGLLPANYRSNSVRNYSRIIDEETDKLIDLQSITTDPVKRKEILREIDRRLTENMGYVTTHWFDYMIAWWKEDVHFVMPLTFTTNVRYAGVWFTK